MPLGVRRSAMAVEGNDAFARGEGSDTNLQVKQSVALAPLRDQMSVLKLLIEEHVAATTNHKIMCFFTTARSTALAAEVFGYPSKHPPRVV